MWQLMKKAIRRMKKYRISSLPLTLEYIPLGNPFCFRDVQFLIYPFGKFGDRFSPLIRLMLLQLTEEI
jgi:hypothetical protein